MSLSHNFFPSVWHFFHLLLWQHWCCFGCPLLVCWLHSDDMNTLFTWNRETKVEVHFTVLIYQNLEICGFVFHQYRLSSFTSVPISWSETRQVILVVFISKVKYLKLLGIYSSAVNTEISVKFLFVWLWQVFHQSWGKSYFFTRVIGKLLCLHSNVQNYMYIAFICHYLY